MFQTNTVLTYSLLLILSTGRRSFEKLGRIIKKSGDRIGRMLKPSSVILVLIRALTRTLLHNKKEIVLVIDDTLIKKVYSKLMIGAGRFYDTGIGRRIMAYKLMVAMVTDGKLALPIGCSFIFSTELLLPLKKTQSKKKLVRELIRLAQRLFPDKKIIVAADGFYSTINFLSWCSNNGIACEYNNAQQ